jgi:hypothetical protein
MGKARRASELDEIPDAGAVVSPLLLSRLRAARAPSLDCTSYSGMEPTLGCTVMLWV